MEVQLLFHNCIPAFYNPAIAVIMYSTCTDPVYVSIHMFVEFHASAFILELRKPEKIFKMNFVLKRKQFYFCLLGLQIGDLLGRERRLDGLPHNVRTH